MENTITITASDVAELLKRQGITLRDGSGVGWVAGTFVAGTLPPTPLANEPTLRREWDSAEEDEAWADL